VPDAVPYSTFPAPVASHDALPTTIVGLSAQGDFGNIDPYTCIVSSAQNVWCWGDDTWGTLGDLGVASGSAGSGNDNPATTIMEIPGVGGTSHLTGIVEVATTYSHACALSSAGHVYCWGQDNEGVLGNNQASASIFSPTEVLGGAQGGTYLSNVVNIAVAQYATCAVTTNGSVYCWGTNSNNCSSGGACQLGNDQALSTSYVPSQVVGPSGVGFLSSVVSVSLSYYSACATTATGNVFCWGNNKQGGLGNGLTETVSVPTQVEGIGGSGLLSNVVSTVSTEISYMTCALLNTGNVNCWGQNSSSDLGSGTTINAAVLNPPIQTVAGQQTGTYLSNVKAISTDQNAACAITKDSGNYHVYCWGNDSVSGSAARLGSNSYDINSGGSGENQASQISWVPIKVCSATSTNDQSTLCSSYLQL
jgi:alpha-tubulin suppressor-like RCC1 family protein